MSLSSSIFQKPCPGCASSVSVSAARCDCGHVFETATSNLSPLEASLRDEELYEGYLAARAEQAHQVAYATEQALAEEADNPEMASAAALAKEVAKSIDDDLAEQRNKIAVIQDILRKREQLATKPVTAPVVSKSVVAEMTALARSVAISNAPVSPVPETVPGIPEPIVVAEKPEPAQSIAATTVSVRPAPEAPPGIPEPIVVAEKPAPTKTAVTTTTAPKRPSRTSAAAPVSAPSPNPPAAVAKPVTPASVPTWNATTAQKAAGVLAALKNAKVRETVARAKNAVVAAAAGGQTAAPHTDRPPQPTPATANASSAAPPSAFRKEQASKAEKIMEAHKSVDTKECPNCTSTVPVNTTRCQCGFTFITGGTELPSLTLCTGDFTALRNSLKLNLR